MPTDDPPSTDRELASLKQEFDDLRQTVSELRAERQQTREQLYQTLRGLGFSGEEIESNVRGLMDHGLTRRAAMLALVGGVGGASFMTGRASAAASTSDGDGDVGTPSNRVDVFADGIDTLTVDAGTVTAGEINNVQSAKPGDDIGQLLADLPTDGVLSLTADRVFDLSGTSMPIEVPAQKTLDLNGAYISPASDANAMFDVRPESRIVASRLSRLDDSGSTFTGTFFQFDVDANDYEARNPTMILGWPHVFANNSGVNLVDVTATGVSDVSAVGIYCELVARNWAADEVIRLENTATSNSFINNNVFRLAGRVGGAVAHWALRGSETINHNRLEWHDVQDGGSDHIADFETGRGNQMVGKLADPFNSTGGFRWQSGAGALNTGYVAEEYAGNNISVTDNSGAIGNYVTELFQPAAQTIDTTSLNGVYDGHPVRCDGTSTSASAGDLATWDEGNSQWRIFNADATE